MNRSYQQLESEWLRVDPGKRREGRVHLIVTRASAAAMPKDRNKKSDPMHEQPARVRFTRAGGVDGDRWKPGMDVESQVSLTSLAATKLVAGSAERWHLLGNNFVVDLDLSADALPAGTRLSLGTGVIEISALPHDPCDRYAARFGQEAFAWAGDAKHGQRHLRGRYARVIEDGEVALGDSIHVLE